MSSQLQPSRPPNAPEIYHALMRPVILQILRAQGYYSCSPAVLDALTEIAGSYIGVIARQTAFHAARTNPLGTEPNIEDVRMALEDSGALWPNRDFMAEGLSGVEDTRAVDDFIRWATGKKNIKIRKVAGVHNTQSGVVEDGVEEMEEKPTDYLSALKKKHNKTDQDSKYVGTILGKGIDHGEVMVEGEEGCVKSIAEWAQKMRERNTRSPDPERPDHTQTQDDDADARPPSSGLSSLADDDVEMMDMNLPGR